VNLAGVAQRCCHAITVDNSYEGLSFLVSTTWPRSSYIRCLVDPSSTESQIEAPWEVDPAIILIGGRCTVLNPDCLFAENIQTGEEKCVAKESVIGANCYVGNGAQL
jgi:hypothetical protein